MFVTDIHFTAIQVYKNDALKEDLLVRIDKLDLLFKKVLEQQDIILEIQIELDAVHNFSVDLNTTTIVENSYYDTWLSLSTCSTFKLLQVLYPIHHMFQYLQRS